MQKATLIVALMVAVYLLTGCADFPTLGSPPTPVPEKSKLSLAEAHLKAGNFQQAANIYWAIAKMKDSPQREMLQLHAAETVLRPETLNQARDYLGEIDESVFSADLLARKRIAEAELALMNGQPQLALNAVPEKMIGLSFQHETRLLGIRAKALHATKRTRKYLETLAVLNRSLSDPSQKEKNNATIWESLMTSEQKEIISWAVKNTNCDLAAWLSLAQIYKRAHKSLFVLEDEIQKWHTLFPEHAVPDHVVALVTQERGASQLAPEKIAILLPMTGRYSANAEAIYAGIATAREFEETLGPPPELVLYDTGDNAANTIDHYQRAVHEGADFIIGPLQKEAVNRVAGQERLPVPTLLLNYTNDSVPASTMLFQFGLLPENEARQVAERALSDNLRVALVLIPEGEWGTRLFETFKTRFSELGGVVLQAERYLAKDSDYSGPIKRLLQLDQSELRRKDLQETIKQKVKFEPHRRQDADFIFMAAFPQQARLLRPQLSYHYASDLPVYATSHIFSGNENISTDQDIEGITYCDLPWILSKSPKVELLRDSFDLQLSSSKARLPRFVALGVDAYRIVPYLPRLAAYKDDHFEGMTGMLNLGSNNRIFRKLTWAQFEKGRPRAFNSFAMDFPKNIPVTATRVESLFLGNSACEND